MKSVLSRSRALFFTGIFALLLAAPAWALPVTNVAISTPKGPVSFTVEIAADAAAQQKGLMYRRSLPPDAGMLFDFYDSLNVAFWMKNTYIPLDMIFIRADGTIANVAADTVPLSLKEVPSKGPVRAVLEINGGRAKELGIEAGQVVHAQLFGNALP